MWLHDAHKRERFIGKLWIAPAKYKRETQIAKSTDRNSKLDGDSTNVSALQYVHIHFFFFYIVLLANKLIVVRSNRPCSFITSNSKYNNVFDTKMLVAEEC